MKLRRSFLAGLVLGGLLFVADVRAGGQALLQITSPASGMIFKQGQTIIVTYTADPSVTNIALEASFNGGFVGQPSTAGTFALPVPATTPIEEYQITVIGVAGGQPVQSAPVSIIVDTPLSIVSVTTTPGTLQFDNVEDTLPLMVTGTLSDGSTATVTDSPQLTYTSTNTKVATVDYRGNVTAAGSGNAFITISGPQIPYNVYVGVPVAAAATPAFNPLPGTFTAPQMISLSDSTSGAAIYYTTDGTAPTAKSTLYSAPIGVSATETISAVAIVSGVPNSIVALGAYTILTPTSLTVGATPNPANLGAAVTLTATLSPFSANGQSSNGESVTFKDGTAAVGTGVLSGGVATLQTTALPAGTDSITASYTGDSTFAASTSAAITVTVVAPNFSLSLNPATIAVKAGSSSQTSLTVTPVGGFDQQITLACSGMPAHATCSFSPATVTPNGSNSAAQSTVTISTNEATADLRDLPGGGTKRLPVQFAFAVLGVLCLIGVRKRGLALRGGLNLALMVAALLLAMAGTALTGCGGGSGSSGSNPPPNQTPAGTYSVTISGAAGNISQSTTMTLTVN